MSAKKVSREDLDLCVTAWLKCLAYHGVYRPKIPSDETALYRLLQIYGREATLFAIEGARTEPKTDKFDPGKYISLARISDSRKVESFINRGAASLGTPKQSEPKKIKAHDDPEANYTEATPEAKVAIEQIKARVRRMTGGRIGVLLVFLLMGCTASAVDVTYCPNGRPCISSDHPLNYYCGEIAKCTDQKVTAGFYKGTPVCTISAHDSDDVKINGWNMDGSLSHTCLGCMAEQVTMDLNMAAAAMRMCWKGARNK